MTFFSTVFYILVIALTVGIAFSILVYVPLFLYIIPYCLWVGFQNTKGQYRNLKEENCFRMAKHATSLYTSWIFHKAPVFK